MQKNPYILGTESKVTAAERCGGLDQPKSVYMPMCFSNTRRRSGDSEKRSCSTRSAPVPTSRCGMFRGGRRHLRRVSSSLASCATKARAPPSLKMAGWAGGKAQSVSRIRTADLWGEERRESDTQHVEAAAAAAAALGSLFISSEFRRG